MKRKNLAVIIVLGVLGLTALLAGCKGASSTDTASLPVLPVLPVGSKNWEVSTLTGTGVRGFANGASNVAQFFDLYGAAVDSSGNIYVADSGNHRIRMITSAGTVSTIAGTVLPEDAKVPAGEKRFFKNGAATTEARFWRPYGVAVNTTGNIIYVADTGNNLIRQIAIAENGNKTVSPFAGSVAPDPDNIPKGETKFFKNGAATTEARFNSPHGVAVDSSGNVYVADTNNHQIRKIDHHGNRVTTLAGGLPNERDYPYEIPRGTTDGSGTNARFNMPKGLAVDSTGNIIYVADSENGRIRKITIANETATVSTLKKTGGFSQNPTEAEAAEFNHPRGVAVDSSGNIYVAANNHYIWEITSDGEISILAGTGRYGTASGTGAEAMFDSPRGVAVDSTGNNIYVTDGFSIRKLVKKPEPEPIE